MRRPRRVYKTYRQIFQFFFLGLLCVTIILLIFGFVGDFDSESRSICKNVREVVNHDCTKDCSWKSMEFCDYKNTATVNVKGIVKWLDYDWRIVNSNVQNQTVTYYSIDYRIGQPITTSDYRRFFKSRIDFEMDVMYSPYEDLFVISHDVYSRYHQCDLKDRPAGKCGDMLDLDTFWTQFGKQVKTLLIDFKTSWYFEYLSNEAKVEIIKMIGELLTKLGFRDRCVLMLYYIDDAVGRACEKYNIRYGFKELSSGKTNKESNILKKLELLSNYPSAEMYCRQNVEGLTPEIIQNAANNGIGFVPWELNNQAKRRKNIVGWINSVRSKEHHRKHVTITYRHKKLPDSVLPVVDGVDPKLNVDDYVNAIRKVFSSEK